MSMLKGYKKLWIVLGILIILTPLGLLATGTAFGEWGTDELQEMLGYVPAGLAKMADIWQYAPLPDYTVPGLEASFPQSALGYIISAVVGVILVAGISMLFTRVVDKTGDE